MTNYLEIFPPLIGVVVDLSNVPDPVFADKMVGDGIAIDPLEPQIYAPFDGVVESIHRAKHAITIKSNNGISILIHVGLETVTLNGNGFNFFVKVGDVVTRGQVLGEVDIDLVACSVKSLISPIIFPDLDQSKYTLIPLVVKVVEKANMVTNNAVPIMRINIRNPLQDNQDNGRQNNVHQDNSAGFGVALIKSAPIHIQYTQGIHARPAALLSTRARELSDDSEIFIEKNGVAVNLKSVVATLGLAILHNDTIFISSKSEEINQELIKLINTMAEYSGFSEMEEQNVTTSASQATTTTKGTTADTPTPNINIAHQLEVNQEAMGKYHGVSASTGCAVGTIAIIKSMQFNVIEQAEDTVLEITKYTSSMNEIIAGIRIKLNETSQQNEHKAKISEKEILSAHLALLLDPQIDHDIKLLINQDGKTAAFAVSTVYKEYCEVLVNSGNKLLIERQNDLKDLCNQILAKLCGVTQEKIIYTAPTILIAEELTPHDLLTCDSHIVGLVSVHGGTTSHVAILAKSYGIPLLVGVSHEILSDGRVALNQSNQLSKSNQLQTVLLDAELGYINLVPTLEEIAVTRHKIAAENTLRQKILADVKLPAITTDGVLIKCYANIVGASDIGRLAENGADGVGLFRTEFMFLDKMIEPTEEEQYLAYTKIANALLPDQPFVIRVLDAGGEKKIPYLNSMVHEENPALGLRGIRLLLANKATLINQLSAILKVNLNNQVNQDNQNNKNSIKVLLPMVSSIEEYREVKSIVNQLTEQLNITAHIDVGVMVEVPSVVLQSELFAKEVAFFSIGTNDLTQYMLSIDREHSKLASNVDHLHPAVLKSIEMVIAGAKKHARSVSVCGLMASEQLALPLLIGLGLQDLSMSINSLAINKAFIRKLNYAQCVTDASRCMNMATAVEVREYLHGKYATSCN
jgi:phosphoenolpyruvate-protein phosphotransferase